MAGCCEHGIEPSGSTKGSEFLVRFEALAAVKAMMFFSAMTPCTLVCR
jgi:hypothetical protein